MATVILPEPIVRWVELEYSIVVKKDFEPVPDNWCNIKVYPEQYFEDKENIDDESSKNNDSSENNKQSDDIMDYDFDYLEDSELGIATKKYHSESEIGIKTKKLLEKYETTESDIFNLWEKNGQIIRVPTIFTNNKQDLVDKNDENNKGKNDENNKEDDKEKDDEDDKEKDDEYKSDNKTIAWACVYKHEPKHINSSFNGDKKVAVSRQYFDYWIEFPLTDEKINLDF